ncbi:MAG: ABC transporter ATP-binding protein [Halanaerobiales bacterium]|nr:ABC transporter ATP-binding protein [Halanaerobiales bacterium]
MAENVIDISNLKKYFAEVKALDGINFSVKKGIIFGMLGPNGAGKTTTIETMTGLYQRDEGEISILGLDPERSLKMLQKKMGVQLQSPSLFPRLKVVEILNLFASFYQNPLKISNVLSQIGLQNKKDSWVKKLSGGQKHRLAVGLAMISNGELIFLDEPTTGLDPQARQDLWNVIRNLKAEGKTVFLTTHYMDEAQKLCDDLVILDKGKIIANGSPEKLINDYFKDRVIELEDMGLNNSFKERIKKEVFYNRLSFEEKKGHVLLYSDQIDKTLKSLFQLADNYERELNDVVIRKATLEDVFLKITGREYRDEAV